MKERPILFSGPMVRALLEGRKTQTRRVVKGWPSRGAVQPLSDGSWEWSPDGGFDHGVLAQHCPYGVPGDRLWVREAWRVPASLDKMNAKGIADAAAVAGWDKPWAPVKYEADGALSSREEWRTFGSTIGEATPGRYRHARFMPRWACRLVLEVTAVRVERLQEISEADAKAEGIDAFLEFGKPWAVTPNPVEAYRVLWDSLNAKRAPWASNPWVWVVEFRRMA